MAAGAGYIEFTTGEVLTASAANEYLASQVVMVFASSSARSTAIASPQEGMVSYLKDTNAIEYYSGSAWTAVGGGGGGGGKVLQVVAAYYSTSTSNSTTTFADTGLTASITPSATTSKVLVLVSQNGVARTSQNQYQGVDLRLLANGTNISNFMYLLGTTNTNIFQQGAVSASYLHSPATTSSVTYKTQFAAGQNEASVTVQANSSNSSIILMEIGA
jgi:hypothetical protein